jgi:hypothetical protein
MKTSVVSDLIRDGTRTQLTASTGLAIEATTAPDDGLLADFYTDYDKAFVIESEKEGYGGFAECLALNAGDAYARLASRFGAFREYVVLATDQATGQRIGGANLIAYPIQLSTASEDAVLSINLNYVFVNSASRGRGFFGRLVRDVPLIAFRLLCATGDAGLPPHWLSPERTSMPTTFVFIEQNDPFKMPLADYHRDTQLTGLDQLARVGIWARLGAKIIDFPYVQPPLSPAQAADENLVLAVLAPPASTLDACLLREHLTRFFGISVLKGREPLTDDVAGSQLAALHQLCADRQDIRLFAAVDLERPAAGATSLRSYLSARSGP